MGQLADQNIAGFRQRIGQIFRSTDIGRKHGSFASGLDGQTENFEARRGFGVDAFPQTVQMRCAKRRSNHPSGHFNRFTRSPRRQTNGEAEQMVRQINRIQPPAQRSGQFPGQIQRQFAIPSGQPRRLHQHRQTARVVGVPVRDQHRIERCRGNAGPGQTQTARFARIDENGLSARSQQTGRTAASRHGDTRSRSEKKQRSHAHFLSPRCSARKPPELAAAVLKL